MTVVDEPTVQVEGKTTQDSKASATTRNPVTSIAAAAIAACAVAAVIIMDESLAKPAKYWFGIQGRQDAEHVISATYNVFDGRASQVEIDVDSASCRFSGLPFRGNDGRWYEEALWKVHMKNRGKGRHIASVTMTLKDESGFAIADLGTKEGAVEKDGGEILGKGPVPIEYVESVQRAAERSLDWTYRQVL